MSAPATPHGRVRRQALAEAYSFALSVARRQPTPDEQIEKRDADRASVKTAGDRQ